MTTFRIAPSLFAALIGATLLSACGSEPERTADDDRDAAGEVMKGTISDAMIPLDQLRSQGDPAEEAETTGDTTGHTTGGTEDTGAAEAAPAEEAAQESLAEPVDPAAG